MASIDRYYKITWMKSAIYVCYVIFTVFPCITMASFFSYNLKFRAWTTLLSSNVATSMYFILGPVFAYYGK